MTFMIKTRWLSLGLLFLIIFHLSPGYAQPEDESGPEVSKPITKQIVMVLVDGLQAETLQKTSAPNINGLGSAGVAASGVYPVFPDTTPPSLVSILTGDEPERHGYLKPGDSHKGDLLPVLMEQRNLKTACLDGTGTISPLLDKVSYTYQGKTRTDDDIIGAALDIMEKNKPFLNVIVLSGPGRVLVKEGQDSPGYLKAVTEADSQVGKILQWLHQNSLYEETMLIVTGTGGAPPLIIKGLEFKAGYKMPPAGLTDIAPTIAYLQGLKLQQATGMALWNALKTGGAGRSEVYLLHQRVKELSEAHAGAKEENYRLLVERITVQEEKGRLTAEKTSYQRAIEYRENEIDRRGTIIKIYQAMVLVILLLSLMALLFQYRFLKKRFLFFT